MNIIKRFTDLHLEIGRQCTVDDEPCVVFMAVDYLNELVTNQLIILEHDSTTLPKGHAIDTKRLADYKAIHDDKHYTAVLKTSIIVEGFEFVDIH
jgi:hypothetical protein